MSLSQMEKKITAKIQENLLEAAPGVQVQVHQAGRKICDVAVGTTYPYYDFASLTKIIFTVQAMMLAYDLEKWNLNSRVKDFVPWYPHETFIREILTHTSGLPWWMPFYKSMKPNDNQLQRWEIVSNEIKNIELEQDPEKRSQAVYSDVGFITLAFVLEALFEKPLEDLWIDIKEKFYIGTTMDFQKNNKPKLLKKYYAPTEDGDWRGHMIQGEVHDENAWSLGGISTHAGLFGSIDDLGWYALNLRAQILGFSKSAVKSKTAKFFTSRQIPETQGDWGLGFMLPTPGSASCGRYFSLASVGHTGFTGTSIWYDPLADVSISILSNRVLMGRDNKTFASLRPQIHNWIIEGLRRV